MSFITFRIFQRTLVGSKVFLGDDSNDEENDGENGNSGGVTEIFHVSKTGEWCDDEGDKQADESFFV